MKEYIGAIVTFIVGFVAYTVYLRQKKDFKREAANVITIEIENAERQLHIILDTATDDRMSTKIKTMPTNSWQKYKYLFVNEFDQNEWDKLTEFYNRCERYDRAVDYNGTFLGADIHEMRVNAHRVLADIAADHAKKVKGDLRAEVVSNEDKKVVKDFDDAKKSFLEFYESNRYFYSPQKPINDATEALKSLETNLSLTSIGTKLKRISRQSILSRIKDALKK